MLQQNAVMSSSDYVSDGFKDVSNMTDEGLLHLQGLHGQVFVHIAKNFMDLPKIKVPLILGVWGGKVRVRPSVHAHLQEARRRTHRHVRW